MIKVKQQQSKDELKVEKGDKRLDNKGTKWQLKTNISKRVNTSSKMIAKCCKC